MLFWIIPILILLVISLFVFFINLQIGLSVLITVFGIIFTTIWLYILLPMREKKSWKIVENEVKKRLADDLKNLFLVTIGSFGDGVISGTANYNEEINWEKAELNKLKEVSNREKLVINAVGKARLKAGNPAVYDRYKENISQIEDKYFKFMKPGEILSLIKIQKDLTYLSNIVKFFNLGVYSVESNEKDFAEYSLSLYKEIYYFHEKFTKLFEVKK